MTRYASFRAQGYPIGSGSVESANKVVVQSRMKQAGMRWGPSHVNAMLAMRNLACNDRWTEGWAAIRGMWRQQERATRAQRAVHPSASGERTSHVLRRGFFPRLSLPRPLSQRPHRSLPPSCRPITHCLHHLKLVRRVLLRPIRGDALSSAVVPLSREVWVLQKSHAHPRETVKDSALQRAFFRVYSQSRAVRLDSSVYEKKNRGWSACVVL